jgi:hypothetical protein
VTGRPTPEGVALVKLPWVTRATVLLWLINVTFALLVAVVGGLIVKWIV